MKTASDLRAILTQRTWDKEVLVWLGSEKSLLEAMGSVKSIPLDLLDLFDVDNLPIDDDETKDALRSRLRSQLKVLPKGPDNRTVLLVKSVGLLARYGVGLKEFYDWFVGSFAMVVLLLENTSGKTDWPDEVHFDARRLLDYFAEPGMVKDVYKG